MSHSAAAFFSGDVPIDRFSVSDQAKRAVTRAAFDHWRVQHRGAAGVPKSIDLIALPQFVRRLYLFDCSAEDSTSWTLIYTGQDIVDFAGVEPTRVPSADLMQNPFWAVVLGAVARVAREGRPLLGGPARTVHPQRAHMKVEGCALPVGEDRITRVFGSYDFWDAVDES